MSTEYGMWRTLFASFHSKPLYRDVAANWGGKAFLYLLFLLALIWILKTAMVHFLLNKGFDQFGDQFFAQVPTLTVKDGKLSTPENHPYEIKSPIFGENLIIIDTSGKTTLANSSANILVTNNAIITRDQFNQERVITIPQNVNTVIEHEQLKATVAKYIKMLWIPFFFVALIMSYLFYIIGGLLCGILGKIFAAMGGVPLKYSQAVQIALVAFTPALIIGTILYLCGIMFPFEGLLLFVLTIIYIIFGVLANKPSSGV